MGFIPVEPAYLYSIRRQASYTWKKIICELIDNSFDAQANNVSLEFPGGGVFRIVDDGIGTSDLMRLITLGKRYEHESNNVGKYGVGCKHALIWLWGVSKLESECKSGRTVLEVNWPMIASGETSYPTSVVNVPMKGKTGTRIECRADRTSPKWQQLIEDLSATYSPGIESGKTICIKYQKQSEKLSTVIWPKTTEEIDDVIEAAGRPIRVRMGIIEDGHDNPYERGFSFERDYRVIKQSLLGANGFSANRVAARITLGKEWELSTNKDDFCEFEEELAEAIHNHCYDLLKRASDQAITYEESQFNQELAHDVMATIGAMKTRREKREPSSQETGTVEPVSTGRKRRTAMQSTDNPGSVEDIESNVRKRGFRVDTVSLKSTEMGWYDEIANIVRLNVGNKWVADMHKEQNKNALWPVIYGILAHHQIAMDSERRPLFKAIESTDMSTLWGTLVANRAESEVMA